MTIKKKESSTGQANIFEWLKEAEELTRQAVNPPKGSLDIDTELRAAISDDIKHAKDDTGRELSRYEVAARMSDLTGVEITKSMLDNFTAESHENHRFPCQFLPSFILATGGQRRAFEVLSRHSGLFALPGPEALRAEIQKLREEEKRISSERRKRELFLSQLTGGAE